MLYDFDWEMLVVFQPAGRRRWFLFHRQTEVLCVFIWNFGFNSAVETGAVAYKQT